MIFNLGPRSKFARPDLLNEVIIPNRPEKMLDLKEGEVAVCGHDPGNGEGFIVFQSLEEMQNLYDFFTKIGSTVKWYVLSKNQRVKNDNLQLATS